MGHSQYYLAEDCPNCGQQDGPGQWRGARVSSTSWGHGYACCSEQCGVAFATNPKRFEMELERIDGQIAGLQHERRELVKELGAAMSKKEST